MEIIEQFRSKEMRQSHDTKQDITNTIYKKSTDQEYLINPLSVIAYSNCIVTL